VVDFGVLMRLPPPPPPSRPNTWSIWSFQRASNHHHLPRVETRAGGGSFRSFNVPPTTTTSLAFKCEPEVVIFILPTCLPPPPPPSRSNVTRRWFFSAFRPVSHHHHHPHIQTRAGGGFFSFFRPVPHHYHLPHVQMRAGGGHFRRFDVTPTTTTSLASKREPEVVIFVVLT